MRRGLLRNLLLLIPGIAGHFIIDSRIVKSEHLESLLTRLDIVYLIIIVVMIFNSLLMMFLDFYSNTDKSRQRPLKAVVQAMQVGIIFIAGIIAIAVLIDKSPGALLTGLGASAAVLMLVFKEGFQLFAGLHYLRRGMILPGALPTGKFCTAVLFVSLTALVLFPNISGTAVNFLAAADLAALSVSMVSYVLVFFGRYNPIE